VSSVSDISHEAQHDEGVSPSAAKRLRDAMDRLLVGRPQRTDGRLIKDNLWKEAGLSRATMNRAVRILAEWNCGVTECQGFTPSEARKNDQLATLRKKFEDKTRECTELRHRLDAAATAIAALHHDNVLLRQELNDRGQLIALQVHRDRRCHDSHTQMVQWPPRRQARHRRRVLWPELHGESDR
jgi:hypothetical protein